MDLFAAMACGVTEAIASSMSCRSCDAGGHSQCGTRFFARRSYLLYRAHEGPRVLSPLEALCKMAVVAFGFVTLGVEARYVAEWDVVQ